MKKKLIYFVLCIAVALPAGAQKLYNDAISITNASLWQQGESLYIDMQIDMRNLKVSSDRTLTLTPILADASHNVALPDIIVNGHRRQKAYIRSMTLDKMANMEIPYDKNEVMSYTQVIPYQSWMENASLNLEEELCGCGGHQEVVTQEPILTGVSTEIKRLAAIRPVFSYIQPLAEVVKARSEQYEAHLDFPVNKSVILPDFMNNQTEIRSIQEMLTKVMNDKKLTVTGVYIEGFASPEGALKLNEQLSKSRAEALKSYLSARENIAANLYHVSFGGENWDGLVKALEASDLKEKETLLSIIRNTSDIARRKEEIKRLNGGAPYRTMLKELYPALRKVNCRIDYTIANFKVEEGKEIIKTQPQYLSLNEMYLVANSYPKGSDDFINVFDIAVRMYPTDETANLNAAAVALSKKDLSNARKYLDKSDKQTAEYANNNGIYYLLNGETEQATAEFGKAAQKGNEAAQYNLREIEKVVKMKRE